VLCSPLLEGEERYTLRWQYTGEIGTILVDVASNAQVRAVPEHSQLSTESEDQAYGDGGKLGLVKSNACGRLNSGMTLADRGDPAMDLATYFEISDQIPSACRCWVQGEIMRGILIQGLPGANRERMGDLDANLDAFKDDLLALDLKDTSALKPFFDRLLTQAKAETSELVIHETLKPAPFCTCSKSKMMDMLKALSTDELNDMIRQDGGAQIDCQFCSQTIRLDATDLQNVIQDKS
jgi:molecular chaperone Hsp33